MTENVSKVIENTEADITDIPMEAECEVSAGLAAMVIIGGAGVLVATGVGLYKLGKRARKYYKERKAQKEMDERLENGDAEESVRIDDSQAVNE